MAKILFGIPMHKPTKDFLKSLPKFIDECGSEHEIDKFEVWDMELVDAQNRIVEQFLTGLYDYLLILEDDHSGHTLDMLNDLIKCGKPLVGIKYYSRHYPFTPIPTRSKCPMIDGEDSNVYGETEDYAPINLSGFGMTLITKEVFNKLDKPYFRVNRYKSQVDVGYATDQDFCKRLIEAGIQPWGCFKHCLKHRDLDESTVMQIRQNHSYRKDLNRLILTTLRKNKELLNV